MEPVFNVVLPVFAIILTGYACGRFGVLGPASSEAINKFVYFVALPVLLFHSTARVDPAEIFNWPFLAAFGAGSIVTTIAAIIFARTVFKTRLAERSSATPATWAFPFASLRSATQARCPPSSRPCSKASS